MWNVYISTPEDMDDNHDGIGEGNKI